MQRRYVACDSIILVSYKTQTLPVREGRNAVRGTTSPVRMSAEDPAIYGKYCEPDERRVSAEPGQPGQNSCLSINGS